MIRAILAHDDKWGIGKDNTLPWPHNSKDLQWFKQCTLSDAVVMGRNTWESLPKKPLPNRQNVVVTRNSIPSVDTITNLNDIYMLPGEHVWIIGGASLIESSIHMIEELWLNHIEGDYECDTFLDKDNILSKFEVANTMKDGHINATIYRRKK